MTAHQAFPSGFLWGAATAAYQVEGNNVGSDLWLLEHVQPTVFSEPSADACDHYHRYPQDIALLASLGLNTYRFSIEWARVEPAQGAFSTAELDHYRRVLTCCRDHGVTPFVTLCHFTTPRWFAERGGWRAEGAGALFARYCERVGAHLGDLIGAAATFNEPNIVKLMRSPEFEPVLALITSMVKAAAEASASPAFDFFASGVALDEAERAMIDAHHQGFAALKIGPGTYPVGLCMAVSDDQVVGGAAAQAFLAARRRDIYAGWFAAADRSDFIGVQAYSRTRIGDDGLLGPEPGVELTQMGYEFWPESLAAAVRFVDGGVKVPIYVTENGIATEDDTRRVDYIGRALAGLAGCLADGIDVRGYIHWSLMDNFEWFFGYRPKFGLIAVDRATQRRTVKPSAALLGQIALRNGL